MFRPPVQLREAVPEDADALLLLWGSAPGRTSDRDVARPPRADAVASIARIAADPDQRLLVAEVDEQVAGAVHLTRAPLSPVHAETAVHVTHLQVVDEYRRHGVGRSLLEAAVTWAEEKASTHVMTAVAAHSRDANRFMARLGLAQFAVVRGATAVALRARLPVEAPVVATRAGSATPRGNRSVGAVLTQRRSLRRAQSRSS